MFIGPRNLLCYIDIVSQQFPGLDECVVVIEIGLRLFFSKYMPVEKLEFIEQERCGLRCPAPFILVE
ncbi:hypothetical protein ES708_10060 [subsurface metagenome]